MTSQQNISKSFLLATSASGLDQQEEGASDAGAPFPPVSGVFTEGVGRDEKHDDGVDDGKRLHFLLFLLSDHVFAIFQQ